jgi:S1-C subfamily serine protease
LVTGIAKGGQADRAGCKPLDVFLEIDGKQIINREQFYSFLGSTSKHKLKVLHWAEIDGDLTVHGTVINLIIKPVPKQEKIVQIN